MHHKNLQSLWTMLKSAGRLLFRGYGTLHQDLCEYANQDILPSNF